MELRCSGIEYSENFAESLSKRLARLDTGDDLERLAETFNQMMDRLEAAFKRITQFTADASHELRTPTALIHHYKLTGKVPTAPGAGTSFWSEQLNRLYVAAPSNDKEGAAILVFEPRP